MLGGAQAAVAARPMDAVPVSERPWPESFRAVVQLCAERREAILQAHLSNSVHLVQFEPGRIELRLTAQAPTNLPNRLGALLSEWTGSRWVVAISGEPGEATLGQQATAAAQRQRSEIMAHPLVQAVMSTFPGAVIESIVDRRAKAAAATPAIEPEDGIAAPDPDGPDGDGVEEDA
jgi:DNA polymerase-3 subunit gamma/tau